jgi:hypothetical protein
MSTIKKLNYLEKQQSITLNKLQDIRCMIRGTYGKAYRRCGKPTCWCSNEDSKGHPSYRISWTNNAKSGTKAIPKEDIAWIKKMTKNYRRWRSLRTKLRKLEQDLKNLLDKLEDEVIRKTEKLREYF